MWWHVCRQNWRVGFAAMGNEFANRCGGMVVNEIRVMGFKIGVVVSEIGGGFFVVPAVGFSWWLSAWVSSKVVSMGFSW